MAEEQQYYPYQAYPISDEEMAAVKRRLQQNLQGEIANEMARQNAMGRTYSGSADIGTAYLRNNYLNTLSDLRAQQASKQSYFDYIKEQQNQAMWGNLLAKIMPPILENWKNRATEESQSYSYRTPSGQMQTGGGSMGWLGAIPGMSILQPGQNTDTGWLSPITAAIGKFLWGN